jgi:anti-sigma-K factor RskA
MNNERIDELIALAVLGELDADQAAELDAALVDDVESSNELDLDLEVAATLQRSLAEPPPPGLKADVMAAIDALDERASDAVVVVPIGSARSRRRSVQTFAAAAAVVMLLAGGLVVFSRTASAPTDVDVVATADDASERVLSEGELAGELAVVFSPSEDAFVLVGTDIPVLTDDETYQLWLVDADGAQSVGLFVPDDDGRVSERYDGRDPSEFTVGVSIEPAGGSDTPTAPIRAATSA